MIRQLSPSDPLDQIDEELSYTLRRLQKDHRTTDLTDDLLRLSGRCSVLRSQHAAGTLNAQGLAPFLNDLNAERCRIFGQLSARACSQGLDPIWPSNFFRPARPAAPPAAAPGVSNARGPSSAEDWVAVAEERAWSGALPADVEPSDLPLWPESLARGNLGAPEARFPSELDEDLEPPVIATFYSLRGGVGRSTALAYTATLLAERDRKVVCVDLDLEAPGLAALFNREADVQDGQGVVEALLEIEQGGRPDMSKHLLRISESRDLYCLPAGIPSADYARKLSLLDPDAWYREDRNPLRELIDLLISELPFRPDVILLDSRTGITRLSGPLLFDLADLAFIAFFPHPQTRRGTGELVRALLASTTRRGLHLAPEPRFIVSPIPATKVPEVVQRYKNRAAEWIHEWLAVSDTPRGNRWTEAEIAHFIPYQEALATSDRILDDRDTWKTYERLAEWVEKFLPSPVEKLATKISDLKRTALNELSFPAGAAELQENLLETFVKTTYVSRALGPDVPLIIGRKGAGKTAIFRWLAEKQPTSAVVVLAPSKLSKPWQLSMTGFKEAENLILRLGRDWRELWATYICIACSLSWKSPDEARSLAPPEIRAVLARQPGSESELIQSLEQILAMAGGALLVAQWMHELDAAAGPGKLVLFDGLDTGFGSDSDARARRTAALEGLFTLFTDQGETLRNLRFKIVLREDLWKKVRFDNKSHLFGRQVKLSWDTWQDYLSVALRQALRAPSFCKLVAPADVERISGADRDDDAVRRAWNLLVGERMKGGNTAYTQNWVWNRLADANGDRGPRALLQLFHEASIWEAQEHGRNPHDRTIIRPRALLESLGKVSEAALDAVVSEEFPELSGLKDRLQGIGRTPVLTQDLADLREEVALAREVGILGVYEGTDAEPTRYKVPEIYRLALGMTRMGQL